MALLNPGPFGHPCGRIGNMVFYMLNGQPVCRLIGEQPNKPTINQKSNRKTMKVVMDVLKPLQKFIKQGFEHKAKGTACNSFNLATSYNKKNALTGTYPNISVDYTKLKLGSGELPLVKEFSITKTEGGLIINWNPTHQWAGDQYDDIVMVALYHPSSKGASLFLNAGKRENGSCFIAVEDENLLNGQIEAYLCFKSADGESISDSLHLGNINGIQETEEKAKEKKEYKRVKERFEKVEANYNKQQKLQTDIKYKNKTFRIIEKEYETLKAQLEDLPGKPV